MTAVLDSEKSVASFYQDHPYLIAPELGEKASFAEQVIGRHRLDLLFRLTNGSHSIVEFKRVPLQEEDLSQVARYWRAWKQRYKMAAKHYLVGLRPRNEDTFAKAKRPTEFKIMVRIIPEDVPCFVRWCAKTRRYVRYKEGDGGDFIELFMPNKR